MLAAAPVQYTPATSPVESAVVRTINRTRNAYGLPRLRFSRALFRVADAHSHDLAAHGTFSHSSSDGTSFADRLRRVSRARLMGETLVEMAGRATAQRVVQAWMSSPQHRAELLTRGFRRVGVGGARRGSWLIVTADFTS
jgi:uncharacterized protein YkwD